MGLSDYLILGLQPVTKLGPLNLQVGDLGRQQVGTDKVLRRSTWLDVRELKLSCHDMCM